MGSVRNAFREAASKYGCIDILVNNAGISESTPFTEYTEETFDKVMDLNVKGVFNATRAASECMIAKGHGVILSTSSMVSIYGQPIGFAHPASKFAVNGLTVSLARELDPKGIRVNAVAPGITLTDMMKAVPKEVIDPLIKQIPLRCLGQPEDIANEFIGTEDIPELPDKDQLILVYCRSGNRSKQASEKLVKLGYTNIIEIGGINSWPGETVAGDK